MTLRRHTTTSERQQPLFFEDINSAIAGLVSALGGAKAVGSRLYPDLMPEAAARRLNDSLNPDRAQQLSQTQFVTLLKWGREAGFHGCIEFLVDEAGYTRPSPRCPEDERAQLQRDFVDAVNRAERLAGMLKVRR